MVRRAPLLAALFLFLLGLARFDFGPRPEAGRMAAVALLMAALWLTEAIPLAATALVPLVLFPLLGIMSAREVSARYLNEIVFLLLGTFLLAQAIERCGLHRRLALLALRMAGESERRLLLGFMATTALLSMWIANTAATSVMVPVALATLEGAKGRTSAALLLAIAYSASLGGMVSLVGTPPNLVFAKLYAEATGREISFLEWLLLALPIGGTMLVALFLLSGRFGLRGASLAVPELPSAPWSRRERWVALLFGATALLWLTRKGLALGGEPLFLGWQAWLPNGALLHDSTVVLAAVLLLFTVPVGGRPVLDSRSFQELPWGTALLFGGGFALAAGFQHSGLTEAIVASAAHLGQLPLTLLLGATTAAIIFLTEMSSNTATTQLALPILAALAQAQELDPIWLMFPATLAASCAFMLPVATPPNAIVFATGRLHIGDMARAGFLLNLIGIAAITLLARLLLPLFFGEVARP